MMKEEKLKTQLKLSKSQLQSVITSHINAFNPTQYNGLEHTVLKSVSELAKEVSNN